MNTPPRSDTADRASAPRFHDGSPSEPIANGAECDETYRSLCTSPVESERSKQRQPTTRSVQVDDISIFVV